MFAHTTGRSVISARTILMAVGLAALPQVAAASPTFRPMNIALKNYNEGRSNTAARSIPIAAFTATTSDGREVAGVWNWETGDAVECPGGPDAVPSIEGIAEGGGQMLGVGWRTPGAGQPARAIVWDMASGAPGTVTELVNPFSDTSWAKASSSNGSVIGGVVHADFDGNGPTRHAAVWTDAGPAQLLPTDPDTPSSEVWGISGDGVVIVGKAINEQGQPSDPKPNPPKHAKGIIWQNGGHTTVEPGVAGSDVDSLGFTGVSISGDTALCTISTTRSNSKGGLYAIGTGGFTLLDGGDVNGDGVIDLFDDHDSSTNALSGDGGIVGGSIALAPGEDEAVVWVRDINGDYQMSDFADFLGSFGVTGFSGWTLRSVTGVSDDGLSFCGWGINPNGQTEGWAASVPAPGACAVVGSAGLVVLRRRR